MKKLEKGIISSSQLIFLLITTVMPTAILFAPTVSIKAAGRDAWLSFLILPILFGITVVYVITVLGMRFPGKNIVEYTEEIMGRWPGKILGFTYAFYIIYSNAIIVRELGEFLVTIFMPETPLIVFIAAVLIVTASAVRNGLEIISRLNELFLPLMFIMLFTISIIVLGEADFKRLLPVMANGVKPVLAGSTIPLDWISQVAFLAIFMPYVNDYKKCRSAGFKAVFTLCIILTANVIISFAIFGQVSAFHSFPTYYLSFYISVRGFFERMEAVIVMIWISTIVIKIAIWYYAAVLSTAQLLELQDYRPIVLPLGVITAVLSITNFNNYVEMVDYIANVDLLFSLTYNFFIPIALLLIAVILNKGEKS